MSKRWSKTILKTLAFVILVIGIHEFVLWLSWDRDPMYFQKDGCMDHGGCWDAADQICRRDEPNAQALCDRSKPR